MIYLQFISGRISSNPGLALIFEEERKRCNINEEKSSNVTDSSLSLTAELKPTSAEQYFRSKLKGKLATVLTVINRCLDYKFTSKICRTGLD